MTNPLHIFKDLRLDTILQDYGAELIYFSVVLWCLVFFILMILSINKLKTETRLVILLVRLLTS